MKRIIAALLLICLLALTGCAATGNNNGSSDTPPEPQNTQPAEIQPISTEEPQVQEADPVNDEKYDPLQGLIRDQYDGLVITAVVLPRMAILPGSDVPVSVVVENTGDKTVTYVLGSGSYETPDALIVRSDSLQPVLFRDRVGKMVTMDYVVKELQPGEKLEFTVNVMAVEPLESFNDITYSFYETEEVYIADADPGQLQELYSEIIPVQPGSYPVQVSFVYGLVDEDGDGMSVFADPTGYAQTELQISVTD